MATKTSKTQTQTQTQIPASETTLIVRVDAAPVNGTDLQALVAQRKALDEQIRAAKAAQPKQSALDRVIARQAANLTKWLPLGLEQRVRARVRAGQPVDEALEAVFAVYRAEVAERLQADPSAPRDDPDDDPDPTPDPATDPA